MTAADKPRAGIRLAALFDAFACLPPGRAMLSLFGDEHEPALRTWAASHGCSVREQTLENKEDGRWTHLEVRVSGGWINVHCDRVQTSTAQADQQVLARVQAVLDGEQPDASTCPDCDGPADHCPDCGAPNGQRCTPGCSKEQPEAALDGAFCCNVCKSSMPGPLGAQCPLEHWPVGYAITKEQPGAWGGSV